MGKALFAAGWLGFTAGVAWLFWGPVLGFLTGMIPPDAQFAWAGKLLCVIFVGWFGGVTIPLVLLFAGLVAIAKS